MRKLLSILAGCAIAVGAIAQDNIDMVVLSPTPQTNTSAVAAGQATTPVKLSGWVDAIIIDVGGHAHPTQTIVVATVGSESTGPSRTILTLTGVSADATYPVRDLVCGQTGTDIANTPARVPLVNDKIIVSSYAANVTTNTLSAYIVIDKDN